jgi:hypothetical protein
MDLDDLLDGIGFGSSRPLTERKQRLVRFLFGLVLAVLCTFGAVHVFGTEGGLAFRLAGVAMFASLAAFGLFSIGFGVAVRQLGCLFVLSFVALFAVRILFGP